MVIVHCIFARSVSLTFYCGLVHLCVFCLIVSFGGFFVGFLFVLVWFFCLFLFLWSTNIIISILHLGKPIFWEIALWIWLFVYWRLLHSCRASDFSCSIKGITMVNPVKGSMEPQPSFCFSLKYLFLSNNSLTMASS